MMKISMFLEDLRVIRGKNFVANFVVSLHPLYVMKIKLCLAVDVLSENLNHEEIKLGSAIIALCLHHAPSPEVVTESSETIFLFSKRCFICYNKSELL